MKMLLIINSFLLAIILPLPSMKSLCQNKKINTGVCGTVVYKSGNQMPSPDLPKSQGKPVQREIVFYELTKVDETIGDGTFFSDIKTKEIKRTQSDEQGKFIVELMPGKYSVFVVEEKGLFANRFDGENHICPIEIKSKMLTKLHLVIDYNAAY